MKLFVVLLLVVVLTDTKRAKNRKLQRTLPNANKNYRKYNLNTDNTEGLQRQKRRLFWNCKVKRHVVHIDCTYYNAEGDEVNEPINPVLSWEGFMRHNQDFDTRDKGSSFQKDHNPIAKSTGSESFNTVEVIPGPRGPQGPAGILLIEEFREALELLKEVDGDIKRSRNRRFKAGGPVLNIVFSNGLGNGDLESLNNSGGRSEGGFFGNLKTDIYLQRLSRLQISNFMKPRSSTSSFNFNSGADFDHRSGTLSVAQSGIYTISSTINLQRMPNTGNEVPDFEDCITGRICMDDDCLVWALETRTPVLNTKFATVKIDGIVRIEGGNKVFLFVENNSGLNFKVLRSSSFSAYAVGSGG